MPRGPRKLRIATDGVGLTQFGQFYPLDFKLSAGADLRFPEVHFLMVDLRNLLGRDAQSFADSRVAR